MNYVSLEEIESNAKTYARTFTMTICKASGCRLWDINGKEYIDFLSCAGALPLGHGHPYITSKVISFLNSGQVLQALDMATPEKILFTSNLVDVLPDFFANDVRIQFCGPTGSDAVEAAIKLFKTATGRRSVVAFHGGYHGMTMGALSLTGNLNPKKDVAGFSSDVHHFPYPNSVRCPYGVGMEDGERISLQHIENTLDDPESGVTKPALVILEAIQGEGGCIPASSAWLKGIRKITAKRDIPLVIDEVQTGLGRTGSWFAFEHAGITPDAVILSKAIGGGFPLAVIAYNKRYDIWRPGAHAGTFRGNQIGMVAGSAAIEFIASNGILDNASQMGDYLQRSLCTMRDQVGCIGDIRGRGLMVGAEVINIYSELDGEFAQKIKKECFSRGLLVETGGRYSAILRFLPSLLITKSDIDQAVEIIKSSIAYLKSISPATAI